MSRSLIAAIVLGGVAASIAGCTPHPGRLAMSQAAEHIIFNSDWSRVEPKAIGRAEWPSTVAQTQFGEDVWYEETVIDWHGRFDGSTAHDYYRRFTAHRTGRARR